jgi:hypothetical protein
MMRGEWRYWDQQRDNWYPWYVKPALELLAVPGQGKRVFEYGCGDSTNWYRKAGYQVYGVDDNHEWALRAGVVYKPTEREYLREIEDMAPYDLVVIDGAFRDKCLNISRFHVKNNGKIIIDNFHQPSVQDEWPETDRLIHELKLKVEIYQQPDHEDWKTAVISL